MLKLAIRHLLRRKIYSTIILLSLTVGFTCTCLLVSFLVSEMRTDSFHENIERTFQLTSNDPFGGTGRIVFMNGQTSDYIKNTFPEVENICQVMNQNNAELEISSGLTTSMNIVSVDSSFFNLFSFPIESGSRKSLTRDGILLTKNTAQQLFGTKDILGKTITFKSSDTTRLLTITGVLGEAPENSHLNFNAILLHDAVRPKIERSRPGNATYVLLHDANAAGELVKKINADSLRPSLLGPGKMEYFLDNMKSSYYSASNKMPFMQNRSETFLWVGWIVCGLILFMASFNFVNLFLLSLQERKKEMGIKKTLGISVFQLMRSSATETFLYIVVSFVVSLFMIYYLLPVFNMTLKTDLAFNYFSKFRVLSLVGISVFVLGLVIVLISTAQQSKTPAISMMRNTGSKVRFSKMLFTAQFFVAITLFICTVAIVRQMEFIENEPLGFNRNILQLRAPSKEAIGMLPELKNKTLQISGVNNAAMSEGNPISGNLVVRRDLDDGTFYTPYIFIGDEDLLKTLDLKGIDGDISLSNSNANIVNETFVNYFKMTNPIGMVIPGTKDRITGVVQDFTCSSFKQEIPPVIISYQADTRCLLIDYGDSELATVIPSIRKAWGEIYPNDQFDYKIIQDDLMKKYSEETLFYKIVVAFSITSMIISCFGLFALSWAVIQSRTREMGIRKVLGASVADVLRLLTASFAKRLLVAFTLAAPLGYYLMNLWLARFVYKAPVNIWIFVVSGVSVAVVAALTLGVQTVRASVASPLDEIKE